MSKVFIITYINSEFDNVINNNCYFVTNFDACKHVCLNIKDEILNAWDMNNPKENHAATAILGLIDNSQYETAIGYYNSYNINIDDGQYVILELNQFDPLVFDENNQKQDASIAAVNNTPQVSGAKCRGCNNYNNYAYADQPNGTYACFSCKSVNRA